MANRIPWILARPRGGERDKRADSVARRGPGPIGYAESKDGIRWERRDEEAGIDVSPSGWDSEMIEYACVFEHGSVEYMLYNGNDYGRGGVGLAVAE